MLLLPPLEKNLLAAAYRPDALPVWAEDEAGPYRAIPYPGSRWHPAGAPVRYPHECVRGGTAKQLALFHPATGPVRVEGVAHASNAPPHPWLRDELTAILATLPEPPALDPAENRRQGERWPEGPSVRITLPPELPSLRLLPSWDNLTGQLTPSVVLGLFARGVMPLSTPPGGSGLNMAASAQRILARRARPGQHPQTPAEIIAWIEATARGGNARPTPFVRGGERRARRERARQRLHRVGGSGAGTLCPLATEQAA